jgi:hypothetical protein
MDTVRVETHGKLQALLGSRKEADKFFRTATTAPGEAEEEEEGEEHDDTPDVRIAVVPPTAAAPATA